MLIGGIETCPICGSPVRHIGYPQCHFFACKDSSCRFFRQMDPSLTRDEAIAEFNRRIKA